jgi:hypothetical protein
VFASVILSHAREYGCTRTHVAHAIKKWFAANIRCPALPAAAAHPRGGPPPRGTATTSRRPLPPRAAITGPRPRTRPQGCPRTLGAALAMQGRHRQVTRTTDPRPRRPMAATIPLQRRATRVCMPVDASASDSAVVCASIERRLHHMHVGAQSALLVPVRIVHLLLLLPWNSGE